MRVPTSRGALSAAVARRLGDLPGTASGGPLPARADGRDDAALALWVLQELHFRGFDGVDERWEWDPDLLHARRGLEDDLEARLRDACPTPSATEDVVGAVQEVLASHDGPSLARHVQQHATRTEVDLLLRQRSVYHLKEADPTSWVVPRLTSRAKAALVEILYDEYGDGDPTRLHHRLFERGLDASGIDATYGAHVDEATTAVLEQNAAMSMFGLQRRLRGAALGHFAAFEATSSLPSRQLAQGLTRLGYPPAMVAYYEEHAEADAVHEHLALRDVCGALVDEEPELAGDVLLGAWTCLELEARVADDLFATWSGSAA